MTSATSPASRREPSASGARSTPTTSAEPAANAANAGLRGTVSSHIARLAHRTCLELGVPAEELARIPGLDEETLSEDLLRVPRNAMAQLWELLGRADRHAGLHMAAAAEPGSLHAWDYLFGLGASVEEGAREAARYLHLVAAAENWMEVDRDGSLLTVRFGIEVSTPRSLPTVSEFLMALILRRFREFGSADAAPVNVAFAHRAPDARARRARLAAEFRTGNLDFGAPAHSMTFLSPDRALPGESGANRLDPELGRILRHYAQVMLTDARPVACWHVRLRAGITEALQLGLHPTLAWTAERMAMSPRTVQRRLALRGSSWREEVDEVCREQAARLLRETELSVQAIATRLGYGNARALRRAFQRWTGQSPADFRDAAAGSRQPPT